MKRKEFIKTTAGFAAATALTPMISCKRKDDKIIKEAVELRKNWAGNYTYTAKNLYEPGHITEVQSLIRKSDTQKALGSRHCFNNIADNPVNQISTEYLKGVLDLNEEAMTVTVGAGTKYGDFAPELHQKGYAIHNLASLPHISVAGACATATHGSGVANGNLATSVAAIELVSGAGEVIDLSKAANEADFNGAVVHLGALGVLTKVTLNIQKTFEVRQDVFQDLPLESLTNNFDDILSAGYSVSLFTDWQNQKISQVWIKRRLDHQIKDLGTDFYGAKPAEKNLHPITRLSSENCTDQMGVPGPWYDRLPHFKMGFTPSSGEELQSEFFVPKVNALDAILALEAKREQIFPQLMITEIRTIAADDLWMSPCYQEDCVAIHFTWKQNPEEVSGLIRLIEAELAPFKARPHWGKLFSMAPGILASNYKKLPDFIELAKKFDPKGKFRNDYLEQNIFS
ncbi:D-arabinono-1,4-lactone oxidase [Muriicola sp. Z0-33]|uniref:D-arabinono-1,4-lactone oxidase n=1 Tax=Muriicola sp. Z0-33 TaxID=2816957 RepID=UPI002237B3FF|nr:D-arabinono-1,4-lactone oxidase [Muriicola sp. Z0-33]MCW5517029.1 FAD-binding protein [Muriicola sp. Z0-33]